jgi:hypothetical protein
VTESDATRLRADSNDPDNRVRLAAHLGKGSVQSVGDPYIRTRDGDRTGASTDRNRVLGESGERVYPIKDMAFGARDPDRAIP